ncbi:PhzF family phenazine biosynthesis protein [Marinobacterium aestuariivivens]|uniref:PhzF family phenazine biosynthesis protein n=1 Tax=Marinobacterium aestuariivivens TaxID=1698799 RepID=A0ABW2A4N7_9GAMM
MSTFEYYTLDVFTDRPFAGNPLAVFPDAGPLPEHLMQQIARELNLSETVFVAGPEGRNRFRVRIFTPGGEIPFAGHPTVGTALLLQQLGRLGRPEEGGPVLIQPVGDVPVSISGTGPEAVARFRTARLPQIASSVLSREDAAALIGLAPEQLCADPVVASCGTPFQLLVLSDPEALRVAQLDFALWRRLLAADPAPDIYIYAVTGDDTLRARMFGPGFGIPEDPATGAAASALAGYLAQQSGRVGTFRWRIEQGVEMGRPSQIDTEVQVGPGGVEAVHVSGQARLLSQGRFLLE